MINAKIILKIAQVGTDKHALYFAVADLILLEIPVNKEQFEKLQAIGIPEIKAKS